MMKLRFILPLVAFLVLVGFLGAGLKLDPREVPSPLIGKPAPGFALTRLDDANQTIRREDMLGKVWTWSWRRPPGAGAPRGRPHTSWPRH